jgi:hypothetical protein
LVTISGYALARSCRLVTPFKQLTVLKRLHGARRRRRDTAARTYAVFELSP